MVGVFSTTRVRKWRRTRARLRAGSGSSLEHRSSVNVKRPSVRDGKSHVEPPATFERPLWLSLGRGSHSLILAWMSRCYFAFTFNYLLTYQLWIRKQTEKISFPTDRMILRLSAVEADRTVVLRWLQSPLRRMSPINNTWREHLQYPFFFFFLLLFTTTCYQKINLACCVHSTLLCCRKSSECTCGQENEKVQWISFRSHCIMQSLWYLCTNNSNVTIRRVHEKESCNSTSSGIRCSANSRSNSAHTSLISLFLPK